MKSKLKKEKEEDQGPFEPLLWRDSLDDRFIAVRNYSIDNRELIGD